MMIVRLSLRAVIQKQDGEFVADTDVELMEWLDVPTVPEAQALVETFVEAFRADTARFRPN